MTDKLKRLEEIERKFVESYISTSDFAWVLSELKVAWEELQTAKKELEGMYSNDTSEWKSAAFQKIKGLESQLLTTERKVEALLKIKDALKNWIAKNPESYQYPTPSDEEELIKMVEALKLYEAEE